MSALRGQGDGWSLLLRAGWPDRLPSRALRNGDPQNEQPGTAEELVTQGHRADLTNAAISCRNLLLDAPFHVSSVSRENPKCLLLPTRTSVTQPSTLTWWALCSTG